MSAVSKISRVEMKAEMTMKEPILAATLVLTTTNTPLFYAESLVTRFIRSIRAFYYESVPHQNDSCSVIKCAYISSIYQTACHLHSN